MWIQQISDESRESPVTYRDSIVDVVRSNIGGFAGWSLGNDFIPEPVGPFARGFAFMHCCTGNSSRALYYAWQGLLDFVGDRLRVNLLLNRASRWADVHSFLPYQGRVDVRLKQPCKVSIRIPAWVSKTSVAVSVAGESRPTSWNGQYLEVGEGKPQETVFVNFPVEERTQQEIIGGKEYTWTLKGNDVVAIDPSGKYCPYYSGRNTARAKCVGETLSDSCRMKLW